MNVGSLFSGIGGLDLGLHRAGHTHVFFCESDPYRRDVLRARWPGVPVYDDVREVCDGSRAGLRSDEPDLEDELRPGLERAGQAERPVVDLLCGGFPCQDLSVAGRRAGLDGTRSGLFFEFARIIESLRPGWILVENVPGLLSSNGGRDFGVVLGTLADIGYGLAWRILDSRFFGVPQRRRRVFIVGAVADGDPRAAAERAGEILAIGSGCARHLAPRGEALPDVAGTLGGGAGERGWSQDTERMTFLPIAHSLMSSGGNDKHDPTLQTYVAATMKSQRGRNGGGIGPEETLIAAPLVSRSSRGNAQGNSPGFNADDVVVAAPLTKGSGGGRRDSGVAGPQIGVRRLTPTECERLQGFPDDWAQLGNTPDSRRYSALGDAVTVNVAEWIGGRLA